LVSVVDQANAIPSDSLAGWRDAKFLGNRRASTIPRHSSGQAHGWVAGCDLV